MSEVKNIAKNPYLDFVNRLSLLAKRRPQLIAMALGNIFTMRLIGNKTHGDLAEVAVTEFVNQYMYDFSSVHVGKKLFRAKSKEEDIVIKNEVSKVKFPVSLKAYGSGPLQLSTDKESQMYQMLEEKYSAPIKAKNKIKELYESSVFSAFSGINILSLIYDEAQKKCNMLVFDAERARKETVLIRKEIPGHKGRKHPVYRFFDASGHYICEVRYGGASANALQRGLWTHTEKASSFFVSVTDGWIRYSHNPVLVKLISQSLVASRRGHQQSLACIKRDIANLQSEHSQPC